MEYVLLTGLVIGAVELVKAIFDRNFRVASIIVTAAIVGALCGVFDVENLDVATGIVLGLAASGVMTVANKVGTGSPTPPTSPITTRNR